MGSGRSLEAAYQLKSSVPAGVYNVICDAIVVMDVDVTIELIHRHAGGDTILATFMEHYEPLAAGFDAQPCERDLPGPAIDFAAGDRFVYRYSGINSTLEMAFIPVGNPESEGGRTTQVSFPR